MRRAGGLLPLAVGLLCAAATRAPAQPLFAQGWQDYGPGKRYEALRNYEKHREQPEKRQRTIEKRYERYQQMPPEERERIRKNYERFQKLPQDQRREYESRYKAMKKGSKQR